MTLARRQLFEFNDSPWAPAPLREIIVEALSRTLAWGRILHGLVTPFQQFLDAAGATEVIDLCAGAGGPAAILASEIERSGGHSPHFLLTDLQPHPEAWTRLRDQHPGVVDFEPAPVDATQIPPHLGMGRARLLINALHHFPPDVAGAILRGACTDSPGVFIAEGFERNPLGFLAFSAAGLPALLATPWLSPRRRIEKALLTWVTPIALAAGLWDGLVSSLRVYTEQELREMVAPLGDRFQWTYGTYRFQPLGHGYFFHGIPVRGDG